MILRDDLRRESLVLFVNGRALMLSVWVHDFLIDNNQSDLPVYLRKQFIVEL